MAEFSESRGEKIKEHSPDWFEDTSLPNKIPSNPTKVYADLRAALDQVGTKEKLSKNEIERLRPFWMHQETVDPASKIGESVLDNEHELRAAHLADWRAHVKKTQKENADAQATSSSKDLIALGSPASPKRSAAEDLPKLPVKLTTLLEKEQTLASRARSSFMLGLRGISFANDDVGKFCTIFARLLEEKNRLHMDAHDSTMRSRLDGASIALLTYGILDPVLIRDSNDKERLSFSVNIRKLTRHAEIFLAKERYKRLEARLANGAPQKAEIEAQLNALKPEMEDAERYISNLNFSLGTKEARTIFESVGNRLYVNGGDLPVFDEPQESDSSELANIKQKSLDAALDSIAARIPPIEQIFKSPQLEQEADSLRQMLVFAQNELSRHEYAARQFSEGIPDDATRQIAKNFLAEALAIENRLDSVHKKTTRILERRGTSQQSQEARKDMFEKIRDVSAKLMQEYSEVSSKVGEALYGKNERVRELEERAMAFEVVYHAVIDSLKRNPSGQKLTGIVEILEDTIKND